MQPVLIKAYASFYPADSRIAEKLNKICAMGYGNSEMHETVALKGDLLLVSFEGIYFPVDEVAALLDDWLKDCVARDIEINGKLDVLDLDAWTLTRFLPERGKLIRKAAPLNNVLDYSGH